MKNYTTTRLGKFTVLAMLNKEEITNKEERLMCYNQILFDNIQSLQKDQIIIINENKTGGIIYGKKEFANIALNKLMQNINPEYTIRKQFESETEDGFTKIGFSMSKEKNRDGWDFLKTL